MRRKEFYRWGIDFSSIVIFLLVMIPNVIWFAIPAPHDILRRDSLTPNLDVLASVLQILMIASLCLLVTDEQDKVIKQSEWYSIGLMIGIYWFGWLFYYAGCTHLLILMTLCAVPCMIFMVTASFQKKLPAFVLAVLFAICHLTCGIVNFW